MHRMILSIAAAAFLAGCSDLSSGPDSSRRAPAVASFDLEGDPPPPPVSGDGVADFFTFVDDNSRASQCSVSETFGFSYQYFVNKTLKNAYLHVQRPPGLQFSLHQTSTKTQANGTITGDGFSFALAEVLGGGIIGETGTIPSSVTLQLTGTLTTDEGSCVVNAQLKLQLVAENPDIIIEN